jgi:exoribonuclease II
MFPMLPEKLSTDLTSFGEGRERLAIVIEMTVAAEGASKRTTSVAVRTRPAPVRI